MSSLLQFTDEIKSQLTNNVLINTVTLGDLDEIDLSKRTNFPLAHVTFDTGTIGSKTSDINMSIIFADIVDADSDSTFESDELYVLNNMMAAATKLGQDLLRGDMYRQRYQVDADIDIEFFNERFDDLLAGVVMNFTVTIENNIELC